MKKLIILLLITSASSWMVSASNVGLFKFDETKLEQVFSELNELEKVVMEHENLTLTDLNTSPLLKASLSQETINLVETMEPDEHPMGIPSFCWGGCFGIAGVFLAYIFSDEDKEEAKKALYGCLVQGVCGGIGYVIMIFGSVQLAAG